MTVQGSETGPSELDARTVAPIPAVHRAAIEPLGSTPGGPAREPPVTGRPQIEHQSARPVAPESKARAGKVRSIPVRRCRGRASVQISAKWWALMLRSIGAEPSA